MEIIKECLFDLCKKRYDEAILMLEYTQHTLL